MDDTDEAGLPPLFDDSPSVPASLEQTRLLFQGDGWSVNERRYCPSEDGSVRLARWLTQSRPGAMSLDQTRVELYVPSAGAEAAFVRDKLNARSSQFCALVAGLVRCDDLVLVLGAGGMALPMALLAADEALRVVALELDAAAIELAARFFGAAHGACGGRLTVLQGDALASVISGTWQPEVGSVARCMYVDIDFLRGGQPPPAFLSEAFWRAAWAALAIGGAIVVNTIGGSEQDVDRLARLALNHSPEDVCAAALEPGSDAARSTWTAFVPRPSMLVLGPIGVVAALEDDAKVKAMMQGESCLLPSWASQLGQGVLQDLEGSQGQLLQIRRIDTQPRLSA